jgi:hypothetical protein
MFNLLKRIATVIFGGPRLISVQRLSPSAQSFFRFQLLDERMEDWLTQAVLKIEPQARDLDRDKVIQIEQATTPEQVLDMVTEVRRLSESAWYKRVSQFGPEVVPLIVERLRSLCDVRDSRKRVIAYERFIRVLRWMGEAGAEALMDCFDDLTEYAKSQACIALGLIGAPDGADVIWAFYQAAKKNTRETHLVGALWGLIDLEDARVADALAELLMEQRSFFEIFGFASLAGDARAVLPLVALLWAGDEKTQESASMALLSIGHRIGKRALMAKIRQAGAQTPEQQREREKFVKNLMKTSPRKAEKYFATFYQGVDLDAVAAAQALLQDSGHFSVRRHGASGVRKGQGVKRRRRGRNKS